MDIEWQQVRSGEVLDGRYELRKSVGKGGMAAVWRAVDLGTGRSVAVKFLRPDTEDFQQFDTRERLAELKSLRGRFRREGALLGRLSHRGIPELFGQGTHYGMPYLVMRLVEGVTLHGFLAERGPLILPAAVAVAAQVADALACAHQLPVVHRDLKPQNIMLSREGIAVLIDFGIAKPLDAGATQYTRHGSTLGSRGYQAPEQILEKEPTTCTDVYALGCVCYKLCTGRAPFVADSTQLLNHQHLHDEPLPPGLHAAAIPDELDALVLRMLAKDPQDRPTVAEVRSTLQSWVPRPDDPGPRPRLDPDPTRPFRTAVQEQPTRAPAPSRRDDEWLDVRDVERLCEAARRELHDGEPGAAVGRLAELAPRVRVEWGAKRPLVRDVWLLAAEGLRLLGDCGGAAGLYDGLGRELVCGDAPRDRAERAVLALRAAECRLAFGEISAALVVLDETKALAAALPAPQAAWVEQIRSEVELDVSERCAEPGSEQPGSAERVSDPPEDVLRPAGR
ncbi:serine/threonine-protein kinase [Streptomyces sp. NPDC051020]|uniref:serine/threonine-protein kinase n=1 Tax=Streptomyces sp. NPDC051020 TaxID=3155409 RepID=UPI003436A0BF